LGSYRQHIAFAGSLGVIHAGVAYVHAGVHWLYGSVALLLTMLSGLLPDLDSHSGVELRGFTGILGVLVALAVWQEMGRVHPEPAFEFHLWAVVCAYAVVRHGLRRVIGKLALHRGMSHSVPTCAVWGALAYLYYPTEHPALRLVMASAVMLGFFSHLLLDELCSVDIQGIRLNKAFGTAIKFWAPSPWSTFGIYALLSYLSWRVIQIWPDGPLLADPPLPPASPRLPFGLGDRLAYFLAFLRAKL
jgi:hypothetical protein